MGQVLMWIGIAAAAVIVAVVGVTIWFTIAITAEHPTSVTAAGGAGTAGRALVVYQPGMSDFPERIVGSFVAGMTEAGWAVDRTTASSQAPTDLSGHDLLVLAGPIYAGKPAKPLGDYIVRLGPLAGRRVALILTGAGDTPEAIAATEAMLASAGALVVGSYSYTTMRPNESATRTYTGSNTDIGIAMAHDDGATIATGHP